MRISSLGLCSNCDMGYLGEWGLGSWEREMSHLSPSHLFSSIFFIIFFFLWRFSDAWKPRWWQFQHMLWNIQTMDHVNYGLRQTNNKPTPESLRNVWKLSLCFANFIAPRSRVENYFSSINEENNEKHKVEPEITVIFSISVVGCRYRDASGLGPCRAGSKSDGPNQTWILLKI